jgi:peroxiredoxin
MHSLASIYALYQRLNTGEFVLSSNRDIQLLKITAARLDTIYPESEFVVSLKRDAVNMENAYKNQRLKSMLQAVPNSLPEISLPDPYGDTIKLSSLHGKVIILSFWASWNEASVELNQEFKSLYGKYHDRGLEIYQVSFDNQLSNWMQSIQYDELPWINVSELSYPESEVAASYNVTDIPAFFLIDKNGEILGKNYERVALDRKISDLINQN